MSHLVRILTPIILALAILLAPAAVPRADGASDELVYLALGDSVPSGADLPDGVGYPQRLSHQIADASGRPIKLVNRAQSGERSAGVLANQLDDLREIQPELVTLTIGANDFMVPAFECASAELDDNPDSHCSGRSLMQSVPTFERNFRSILGRLVNDTGATIVVTTYYNPFPRGSRCAPGTTDLALRFLNRTIADVAREYGDRNVVVDLAPIFKGHEGRAPTGWFSPSPTHIMCTDIHPSAAGHDAIASAIVDALSPRFALGAP
jgi:lysophospholipase L1-like esterase